MSKYAVMPLSDYDNACDKIREKTETAEPIKSGEFAGKVEDVYNEGLAEGIEQGKEAEWNAFWDTNQQNGNRTNYTYAYSGGGWNKNNFKPKYDIRPNANYGTAEKLFFQFGAGATESVDLVELAEQQGIEFDFSQVREFTYTFASVNISRIGTMDMRNATACGGTFYQYDPYALRTIEKIISAETTPWLTNSFGSVYNLKEVRFDGIIARSLEFNAAGGLSKASIQSIVSVLSNNTSGFSVTFNKWAVKRGFETSEGALDGDTSAEWLNLIATKPNWSIKLV